MRETLDMMPFVIAAYAITIISVVALVGWSWIAMRRAEKQREETRGK